MAYRVPRHIWRTKDGRLVPDGDPEAAFLAYAAGDELSDSEAKRLGVIGVYPPEQKQRGRRPRDKQAAEPANKSGSGVTITRGVGHG